MRRAAAIAVGLLAAAGLAAWATACGGGDRAPTYTVELDNAFGLVSGSDVKVAGVRAGSITSMRLDRRTHHALVGIRIDKTGFGSLRTDVRCVVRPQSLLGEYYVDCLPGTARRALPGGARIPVEKTSSTVPPDLVLNVMRMPYRERLRLIVAELGAGAAANGPRLSAALRRAVPAIDQTHRVLHALGTQDRALRGLIGDADTVTSALAARRTEVSRWVREARDTASAAARRRPELAEGLQRLPAFLREVSPSMRALGDLARDGAPSLSNLSASAGRLDTFLGQATDVSRAARPAVAALGQAAAVARPAIRSATPAVAELRRFGTNLPELAQDIALVVESLDDRDQMVEAHPLSPGGKGYTALENVMNYIFNQVLAINIYDAQSHILKGAVFTNDCAPYEDTAGARGKERCETQLGPTRPGINAPDPTRGDPPGTRSHRRAERHDSDPLRAPTSLGELPRPAAGAPAPATPAAPPTRPAAPAPALPPAPAPPSPETVQSVLDYLLGH